MGDIMTYDDVMQLIVIFCIFWIGVGLGYYWAMIKGAR